MRKNTDALDGLERPKFSIIKTYADSTEMPEEQ
jgi:hypothetical protein